MNLIEKLKTGRIYFDGGYGTYFQSRGLKLGELPERWNITHKDEVINIHKAYLEAGSDVITANTFGANLLKFDKAELEEIVSSAIENVREATKGFDDKYVALDIGPSGKLLKPLGDLDFEEAVSIFAETVKLGVKYGADLIIIETMNDCYETKAAVLAAKENSSLPVFVTNTYDENGKLMTGANVKAMVAMLEGLRVDAIGINCGLGPDKMLPIVEELIACSSTPVIVNPNAGLPVITDGKTEFKVSPCEFSDTMIKIAKMGASVLGGCCGTTPAHIEALKDATFDIEFKQITEKDFTVVSSYTHEVRFGGVPILIGERVNPTGKPLFKTALREQNFDYIIKEGISQEEKGADILDVNVGLPEIDEKKMLTETVKLIQTVSDLPLQLDTSDASAMESALRIYNGKALVNSVNGKQEVMDEIFPLVAKYGGTVIALTLDEQGIPETVEGRIKIAEKIIENAEKYGIKKKDIIVDPLALTVSASKTSAITTLGCIEELRKREIKTSLGVSNVSFGLPKRELINSAFFAMALTKGLNAAIMNPHSEEMMSVYHSFRALSGMDENCVEYIKYASNEKSEKNIAKGEEISGIEGLKRAIIKGLKEDAKSYSSALLNDTAPIEIINSAIIPALNEIGTAFEQKKAFLPQLLMSAEVAKEAFDVIKASLATDGFKKGNKAKILLATVKGDIHDIGKNIVKVLLENYDFPVIDLGKDVSPEQILETAKKENVAIVGLSALMTTTVPAMQETIKLLKKENIPCKIMVGGAVLTEELSKMIGADKYAKDAMEAVRYAEQVSVF